jgi:hypothetical protein
MDARRKDAMMHLEEPNTVNRFTGMVNYNHDMLRHPIPVLAPLTPLTSQYQPFWPSLFDKPFKSTQMEATTAVEVWEQLSLTTTTCSFMMSRTLSDAQMMRYTITTHENYCLPCKPSM